MDKRVKNFISAIENGVETELAIKESGIDEMNTHDVLVEIAMAISK